MANRRKRKKIVKDQKTDIEETETTDKAMIEVDQVTDGKKKLRGFQWIDRGSKYCTTESENTCPGLSVQKIGKTDQKDGKALIKNEKGTDQKSKEEKKVEEEEEEEAEKEEKEKEEKEEKESISNKYTQKEHDGTEKHDIKRKNITETTDINAADEKEQNQRHIVEAINNGWEKIEAPVNKLHVNKKIDESEKVLFKMDEKNINKNSIENSNAIHYNLKNVQLLSGYLNDSDIECGSNSDDECDNDYNGPGIYNHINPDELMQRSEQYIENEYRKQTNEDYLDQNYKGQIVVDGTNQVNDLLLVSRIAYNDNLKQTDNMQMLKKKNEQMRSLSNVDTNEKMEIKSDEYETEEDLSEKDITKNMAVEEKQPTVDEKRRSEQHEDMSAKETERRYEVKNVVINYEKKEKEKEKDTISPFDDRIDSCNKDADVIINKSDIHHFVKGVEESKNNKADTFQKQICRILLIGCPEFINEEIQIQKLGKISNIEKDIIEVSCEPLKYIFNVGTVLCLDNRHAIGCIANVNCFGNKLTCFAKVIFKSTLSEIQIGTLVFVDLDHALYMNMNTKVCRELFDTTENTTVPSVYINYRDLENVGKMQLQSVLYEKLDDVTMHSTTGEKQMKTEKRALDTQKNINCDTFIAGRKVNKQVQRASHSSHQSQNTSAGVSTVQSGNTNSTIILHVPNRNVTQGKGLLPTPNTRQATAFLPNSNPTSTLAFVPNPSPPNTIAFIPNPSPTNTIAFIRNPSPSNTIAFVPNPNASNTMAFVPTPNTTNTRYFVPNSATLNTKALGSSGINNNNVTYVPHTNVIDKIPFVPSSNVEQLYFNNTPRVGVNTDSAELTRTVPSYYDTRNKEIIIQEPNNPTLANVMGYHNTTAASNTNNYLVTKQHNDLSNVIGDVIYVPVNTNRGTFYDPTAYINNAYMRRSDNYSQLNPVDGVGQNWPSASVSSVPLGSSVSPFASGTTNYATEDFTQNSSLDVPPPPPPPHILHPSFSMDRNRSSQLNRQL